LEARVAVKLLEKPFAMATSAFSQLGIRSRNRLSPVRENADPVHPRGSARFD
jgi:hypothetical protein